MEQLFSLDSLFKRCSAKDMATKSTSFLVVLICLALYLPVGGRAQNLLQGNAGDPDRIETEFVNPAVNAIMGERFVSGLRVYHIGILDNSFGLKTGFFSYHFPWNYRGLVVNGQFFNSSLYRQSNFGLQYARGYGGFCVGGSLNLFSKFYVTDRFNLEDKFDPVFENGTTKLGISLGAGILAFPLPFLTLGLSVEHLNQPNISLINDDVWQPMAFHLGIKYNVGRLRPSVGLGNIQWGRFEDQGIDQSIRDASLDFEIESPLSDWGIVRLGYNQLRYKLEGQFHVTGGLSINCSYDIPATEVRTSSIGTPQLTIIYDFDRLHGLPEKSPLILLSPKKQRATVVPSHQHQQFFYTFSPSDRLHIFERNIVRRIDSNISAQDLSRLSPEGLGTLSSIETHQRYNFKTEPLKVKDPLLELEGTYTAEYHTSISEMTSSLKEKPQVKASIIAFPGTEHRANSILNFVTGEQHMLPHQVKAYVPVRYDSLTPEQVDLILHLPSSECQITTKPDSLKLSLLSIHMDDYRKDWSLVILDDNDRLVHRIDGQGLPLTHISWDWKLEDGSLIKPGYYSYHLCWFDETGNLHKSKRQFLTVQKTKKVLNIEITRRKKEIKRNVYRYDLILSP